MFALETKPGPSARRGPNRAHAAGRTPARPAEPEPPALWSQLALGCRTRPQGQLVVGRPGDALEREADSVAEAVLRRPAPSHSIRVPTGGATGEVHAVPAGVQRVCDACEDEEGEHVQRAPATSSGARAGDQAPSAVAKNLAAGTGHPLDPDACAELQGRFGQDFGRVRVHTDSLAAESARAVGARAYTVGQHVTFAAGEYAPRTTTGRALLAHELTHTLQQRGGAPVHVARSVYPAPQEPAPESGPAPPGVPPGPRVLDFITINRNWIGTGKDPVPRHIGPLKTDYGHWWTKIEDQDESYGWWPDHCPVTAWETVAGTNGVLNGITDVNCNARQDPKKDPYHDDQRAFRFNPVLRGHKTDAQVRHEIRSFATSYSGEWRWTLGQGQNCRSFQLQLMSKVGLEDQAPQIK